MYFSEYVNVEPFAFMTGISIETVSVILPEPACHLTSLIFINLGSSSVGAVFPVQSLLFVGKQSAPFVSFPDGEDPVSSSQPSWTPAGLEAEEGK